MNTDNYEGDAVEGGEYGGEQSDRSTYHGSVSSDKVEKL